MQFFKTIAVCAATLATFVTAAPIPAAEAVAEAVPVPAAEVEAPIEARAAAQFTLINKCSSQIFVSNGNNAATPLAAGKTMTAPIQGSAVTYKMGMTSDAMWTGKIAQVEWTVTGSSYSYDLSLQKGNPFKEEGQNLKPSTSSASCVPVTCQPGQFPCPKAYNTEADNQKSPQPTWNCPASTSLTFTACDS